MEEYTQLTMDLGQYREAKEEIKKDLSGIVKSFVRVGWQLSRINRSEAYQLDGYKTIAEFAKAEYGMTPSGVSRFMEVYERYSVEGDTPALKEQYREYNFSQLTELLQISEEDQAMFQPEVKRETIREFKAFQKENDGNPENLMNWMKDPEDDFGIAVKEFFRANPEIMDELFASREYAEGDEKGMAELINPSGSMHFRKETRFLIFYGYEKGLMINRFG